MMTASTSFRTGILTTVLSVFAAASQAMGAATYHIDKTHSTVIFRIKHLNVGQFYGRFLHIAGDFSLDDEQPKKSFIKVSVETGSVRTDHGDRDQEIKSPRLLDEAKYPSIDFVSHEIKKVRENNYEVTGDLTFHGVTKPITVQLEHIGEARTRMGVRSGIHTIFTIKRSDYGLDMALNVLGDEVQLIVSLEGVRVKQPG